MVVGRRAEALFSEGYAISPKEVVVISGGTMPGKGSRKTLTFQLILLFLETFSLNVLFGFDKQTNHAHIMGLEYLP